MSRTSPPCVGVQAIVLSPFHYHSLAVPSGTATQPDYLTDRQMSFALGAALGCLSQSLALPAKNYRSHLMALPFLASVFETRDASLLPPLARWLNLDDEAPVKIEIVKGTANLKTHFFIQEVPPGIVYEGCVFGADPFALAARAEGRPVREIVVRTGRHLGGLLKLERLDTPGDVRLNVHTASLFGGADDLEVDIYAMHDLQVSRPLAAADAWARISAWRPFSPYDV